MVHITTAQSKTNSFQFPEKFQNYRRVLVIMTINKLVDNAITLRLRDNGSYQELSVGNVTAEWFRNNFEAIYFVSNINEPCRIQFEITPYKYKQGVKTEMKLLFDNKNLDTNTNVQLGHLTFNQNIDDIMITSNADFNISYSAYGELE